MAEIQDKAVVIVPPDSITFTSKTNGDKINIKGVHVEQDDAAALAYMIQSGKDLKVIFKEK